MTKNCVPTNCKTHRQTDRQTVRLAGSPTETLKKKLMILLPMHQNIPTETRETTETLTCYILFSESGGRKKKERKKEHCDPFLSSIPHHPTAADQRWIYGCIRDFVKWAAK
jgi:hypothetical protein